MRTYLPAGACGISRGGLSQEVDLLFWILPPLRRGSMPGAGCRECVLNARYHATCLLIRPRIRASRLYGPAPAETTKISIKA